MATFAEIKAKAALPERSVPICLRGDLVAEFERLERAMAAEQDRAPADSFDAGARISEFADRLAELHQQMLDANVEFRFRALPHRRWRELLAEHPVRRDADDKPDEGDVFMGVNRETFPAALMQETVVEPVLSAAEWRELLEEMLTDRQYDDLHQAAWDVNRSRVKIPFSQAASQLIRSSSAD